MWASRQWNEIEFKFIVDTRCTISIVIVDIFHLCALSKKKHYLFKKDYGELLIILLALLCSFALAMHETKISNDSRNIFHDLGICFNFCICCTLGQQR